jgi:hypothetical protein
MDRYSFSPDCFVRFVFRTHQKTLSSGIAIEQQALRRTASNSATIINEKLMSWDGLANGKEKIEQMEY